MALTVESGSADKLYSRTALRVNFVKATIRPATRQHVEAMHAVRMAVRENRLMSTVLTSADYVRAIEVDGRGWVAMVAGAVVGFGVGTAATGNVWALFVHPDYERRSIGRQLLKRVTDWLTVRGCRRVWLTTSPGTRAAALYERAGWRAIGPTDSGETEYEFSPTSRGPISSEAEEKDD